MEQQVNLKFVSLVEKYPVLYNYKEKGYTRKDVTDKAWSEVGKEVNMTVNEAKEKWRNLRAVYVRNMKPPPSGAGIKTKKPYYLAKAMEFTLPFIRTLGTPTGNLPSIPSQNILADQEQESTVPIENIQDLVEEEGASESLVNYSPSPCSFTIPSSSQMPISSEAGLGQKLPSESPTSRPRTTIRRAQKRSNVDKSFAEYLEEKSKRLRYSNSLNNETAQNDEKKMFLLSLMSEIAPMTEPQMKSFRRGVLQLIDNILNTEYINLNVPIYQHNLSGTVSTISGRSCVDFSSEELSSDTQLPEDHGISTEEVDKIIRDTLQE